MILDLEDICLEICPAIGNTAFGIGIGITYEQEENASSGHLQDDGVLVDIIREGGGWVEDREGPARVRECMARAREGWANASHDTRPARRAVKEHPVQRGTILPGEGGRNCRMFIGHRRTVWPNC